MKKIFILLVFIYFAFSNSFAAKATSVISGVEGTFKRTRGENFRAFYNSVFSQKIFSGMDELAKEVKGDLYFVSDSYNFMEFTSVDLLKDFDIRPKELATRKPFRYESEFAYKLATYKRILESSEDKFILVGNDKGSDQEVFLQLKKIYPGRILESYIHVVENEKKIAPGMTPYHTAFDIAANEYGKGRMNYAVAKKIGQKVLSEEKFHKIFPKNAHCPKEKGEINTKSFKEFDGIIGKLTEKTLDFCNS